MATIYTRATKGSALTWTEGDANITNLNTAKIELTNLSVTDTGGDGSLSYNNTTGVFTYTGPSAAEVRAHFSAGTNITIVDGVISSTASGGGGDLVDDLTPQLGGDLDVNGKNIVSVSNGNIVIEPNGTGKTVLKNINYYESPVYDLGTTSGTIAPNVANGNVQKITLTGNLTLNAFTSPIAGQSLTLIVTQDGTGGRTLTSTMKYSGGIKTLSTAANSVDILTIFYDGTNYWASLSRGFV
jgi:hypothetical protein